MEGYVYKGVCGACIEESWQDNVYFVRCQRGMGMQGEGGFCPTELCEGCQYAKEETKE